MRIFHPAFISLSLSSLIGFQSFAAIPAKAPETVKKIEGVGRILKNEEQELAQLRQKLMEKAKKAPAHQGTLIFDIPVTYNRKVAQWLSYFQNSGRVWFRTWLENSTKYMPFIQDELRKAGLPTDLAFMVMIESGFNPYARSPANAVGPWQFIQATGTRYGLKTNWWLDERKDYKKATLAAIRYMKDLYAEFGSWYLVAASYNMGENGLRRRINANKTRDFWALSNAGKLPQETIDYVPKILAVMLISKAPSLYGFRDLARLEPLEYDLVYLEGGTDMAQLADHLGVTRKFLKDLNAELVLGYIPLQIQRHAIRVPRGSQELVMQFVQRSRSASTETGPKLAN